jgi:hypothetical protein
MDVLLRPPLHIQKADTDGHLFQQYPLWWFRGHRNMHIDKYARLGQQHCVIGIDQLRVKRIASFRAFGVPSLYDFLYVESRAEPPVGVYAYEEGEIEEMREKYGFAEEEYALWKDQPIKRSEYDDGAAIIGGRPVRTKGAQVRARFLTDYNFILCGNRHVINENALDAAVVGLLNGILKGTRDLDTLAKFVRSLTKPPRYFADEWV